MCVTYQRRPVPPSWQAVAVTDMLVTVVIASVAASALAVLSGVAGFGGGVLLLPVFTGLFGLRVAVPLCRRSRNSPGL
jgi:hypothetical protein